MHLFLVASLLLVVMPGAPSSVLVTTSKALVSSSGFSLRICSGSLSKIPLQERLLTKHKQSPPANLQILEKLVVKRAIVFASKVSDIHAPNASFNTAYLAVVGEV